MIGGVVLAGVVLGSVVAQTGYHAFEKQVSETQGELTADSKDALPDQKTIEANKKKNETERKQEEQQEQEDEKEDEITISVDEATPVEKIMAYKEEYGMPILQPQQEAPKSQY